MLTSLYKRAFGI